MPLFSIASVMKPSSIPTCTESTGKAARGWGGKTPAEADMVRKCNLYIPRPSNSEPGAVELESLVRNRRRWYSSLEYWLLTAVLGALTELSDLVPGRW